MSPTVLRLLLAVAYPLLAHATQHVGPVMAALALFDLALLVLLQPLGRGRAWAWMLLALIGAALWRARDANDLPLLLLAPPMLFTGGIAWVFARSLIPPRQALITRIACAIEERNVDALPPGIASYTRRLTAAWAALLVLLTVSNIVLALIAVPDGVLVRLGYPPLLVVSQLTWSWFAHVLDYGIIGGFMVGEYLLRDRLFPDRAFRRPGEFARRARALGPDFWRDVWR